ncbi:MAG TPA: oxygenase MpaB family protein [Nevskiaceae bacterium]|nr:oxygenase MpaB family protein [Nevskiaceae bacterium]
MLGPLRWFVDGDPTPSPERWQAIGEAILRGDPPMDRLVDWMFATGMGRTRPLFEQALERGIGTIPDAPAPLREFFALVDTRPSWVDDRLVRAGARVAQRGGRVYWDVARDLSLMGGYQASAFNRTLLLTGALQKGATRRIAETASWWLDCTADGGMERFGAGFKSTLRVRLIHALVRRHVAKLPTWRTDEWGLPVNQTDMAATLYGFPVVILFGGRLMGVPVSRRDSEAAMHHGCYAGWLMGVEEQWLPWDENTGRTLLYQITLSIARPDETSVQLGRALMDEPHTRPWPFPGRLRAWYERERNLSINRFFLDGGSMRNLGLPKWRLPWYPLAQLPFTVARHLAARATPGGMARLARRGYAQQLAHLREHTGTKAARIGESAPRDLHAEHRAP